MPVTMSESDASSPGVRSPLAPIREIWQTPPRDNTKELLQTPPRKNTNEF